MKIKTLIALLFCLGLNQLSFSQDFSFEKVFDIVVKQDDGKILPSPWVGGLNACIFGEVRLNNNERILAIFDNHGQKLFTFKNKGIADSMAYAYAPQYESSFPPITSWFTLLDFNGDGKEDLFTFNGVAGISLYKNVSNSPDELKFELYIPRLKANYIPGSDNYNDLYCASVDYPAFVDIDGDGDLDLLNFWLPSSNNKLFLYRNYSMEKYGHADSLDFILEDDNWGCFKESEESNEIILNTCSETEMPSHLKGEQPIPKHTGSSVFITDLNRDSLPDLLLGDFGFPNVVSLINGGTKTKARIVDFDMHFPSNDTAVNLLNCPAIACIDIDNDGDKELIFSPFNTVDFSTEAYSSNWVYKNASADNIDYKLISRRFLQEDMLDFGMSSYPTFVDLDQDGLTDIVVGSYGVVDSAWEEWGTWTSIFKGELHWLRNVGTSTHPEFEVNQIQLTPEPQKAGLVPTFGDIDNDGELDLLLGTADGAIMWYKYDNRTLNTVSFQLHDSNMLAENIGTFLAPQLFDLDKDGKIDLIIGEKQTIWTENGRRYYKGNINYFRNIGTAENPDFMMVTDSLGRVDVCNRELSTNGYSKPHFFRNSTGNTMLFSGNEDGKILFYNNIDENLNGEFNHAYDLHHYENQKNIDINEGSHTAISVADINNDGYPDLIVGNQRGGLTLYFGREFDPNSTQKAQNEPIYIYPNPVNAILHVNASENKGTFDIFDIKGAKVKTGHFQDKHFDIDVKNFKTGIYILNIRYANHQKSVKFIKI